MLSSQFETFVALDSCVLIGMLRSPRIARKIIKMFRGGYTKFVLQDVVLIESSKVLKLSKEEIIVKVNDILRKEVCVFSTTDEMRTEGSIIEEKYGVCHFPDSIILVAAKKHSWTVLTLDRNMLRTASFEGILALNPIRVGGF